MKKAFIFDLFGTLVDVYEKKNYNNLIKEMSSILNIDFEDFRKCWNIDTYEDRMIGKFKNNYENIKYILEVLQLETSEKNILSAIEARTKFARKSLESKREHLLPTLLNIKNRGFKIGLISDCSPDVPEIWNLLDYSKYFDSVIFSCKVGIKKPNSKIYQMSVDSLSLNLNECYYIGDGGSNELTGAKKVGMYPILIKSKADEEKHIYKKYADKWNGERIFCLSELMNYE